MKTILSLPLILFLRISLLAQVQPENLQYEPTIENPYGLPNPNSPEVLDFKEMIGTCDCKSVSRNPDQSWADTTSMLWKYKYVMNGTAVQDEVWRENGAYAGSIRQYHQDSAQWVVSYYSYPGIPWKPGVWHGKRIDNQIVLYKDSPAPNGTPGDYRLTFYDLSDDGFNWKGEWVDKTETVVYPTWMIFCTKRKD
ncbi:MAG: hypothetical protein JXR10_14920 [Cyclobacteriaceae bacterium]